MRFIVIGHSPRLNYISKDFLYTGNVIAINQTPAHKMIQWLPRFEWITWDHHPHTFKETKAAYEICKRHGGVHMWVRNCSQNRAYYENHPRLRWYDEWLKPSYKYLTNLDEREEKNKIRLETYRAGYAYRLHVVQNTATTACHLACLQGASEIYLVGVDFVGKERADGSKFGGGDINTVKKISDFMNTLPVPIYKTMEESPLQLECKPEGVYL